MRESRDFLTLLECYLRVLSETVMNSTLNVYLSMMFILLEADIETILNWTESSEKDLEIPFKPARVLLQDFTIIPLDNFFQRCASSGRFGSNERCKCHA